MNIPERPSAKPLQSVSFRLVQIADTPPRRKQDVQQVSQELAQVVALSEPGKSKRCRLAKGKQLSEKELEVLKWARAGKTVWEISVIRSVSEATVKFHLRNIYHKLGVSNRAHAVGEAVNRGLV